MLTMLTVKPIIQERFPFLLLSKGSRRYRRRHTWKFQIHLWLGKKHLALKREKSSILLPKAPVAPRTWILKKILVQVADCSRHMYQTYTQKQKCKSFLTCATIRSSRRWANSYQNIGMFANRAARGPGGIWLDLSIYVFWAGRWNIRTHKEI